MIVAEKDKMTVLVADDMSNMRRTIKNMLRTIGFKNVIEASDGQKAWEKIKANRIDFVVTDWNMPKITGFELLKKIREDQDTQNTPVLMVTAELSEAQVAHAAEKTVDGYILKPFEVKTLEKKIDEILERRSKPNKLETILNIGKALVDGKMFDRALIEYTTALPKFPKSSRLLAAMADCYVQSGDSVRAEAAYKKAVEINPLFMKAMQGYADLLKEKGDLDSAVAILEKAALVSPNDPDRQKEIGKIHLKKGNTAKAQTAFNAALKNAGSDHSVSTEIGEMYLEAGMADLAANSFKKSLAVDPNNIHVYNRLGIALRRKGRHMEAIEEYKKALSVAPDDEVLYFNISKAYVEAKRVDQALDNIKEALRIDPDFQEAKDLFEEITKQKARLGG